MGWVSGQRWDRAGSFCGVHHSFLPKEQFSLFQWYLQLLLYFKFRMPWPTFLLGESTRSTGRAQRSLQLLNNQKALQITAMPKRRANQISFESYKEKQKLKALILNLKTMHMYEPHWSLNIHFVFHPHCLWLQSFAKNITFKHNTSTFWKSPNPLFPSHCLPPPKYTTTNFW